MKYQIIEQIVNMDDVDSLRLVASFDDIEQCNDYLLEIYSKNYGKIDMKLLRNESLFIYKWSDVLKKYKSRVYYRIFESRGNEANL